jgi:hypothetical protein
MGSVDVGAGPGQQLGRRWWSGCSRPGGARNREDDARSGGVGPGDVGNRSGRFASPSSHTAPPSRQEVGSSSSHCTGPPPSRMQEVGSSRRRRTAPPPSRQEEASSGDSVEMWMVAPPTRLVAPPPPPPPLTIRVKEVSSDDSPSNSSGYNDECPHIKKVSSYELLLDFNYLVQLLNVHVHFQI